MGLWCHKAKKLPFNLSVIPVQSTVTQLPMTIGLTADSKQLIAFATIDPAILHFNTTGNNAM